MPEAPDATEARFLALLHRAVQGWQTKVDNDFSEANANAELVALESDSVYSKFGLATNGYVLIRLMGRMSISIGRRLGELYDNLPKFVAAARFDLAPSDVAARIAGLNLDVCIPFDKLEPEDEDLAITATVDALGLSRRVLESAAGLGIEIRYNFNPNDSARLRKDEAMAAGLIAQNLVPIYLVYSGISPREEAIARLRRAGWNFLIAQPASAYTKALLGLDVANLLESEAVQERLSTDMDQVMSSIVHSKAMEKALGDYRI